MQIETIDVELLKLDPKNARTHDRKNLDVIKSSLAKFGQQKNLVVDKDNVVIAGNGLLIAAKELGLKKLTVNRFDLPYKEAKAFALADNRASELSEWDDDILRESIRELEELDFNVGDIGFDLRDFGIEDIGEVGLTDPDEIPEVTETICKPGDLWILGEHRLLCGDSTNKEDVARLMSGVVADILFTSPPYNAGKFEPTGEVLEQFRKDNNKSLPKMTQKYANNNDSMSEQDYYEFLEKILLIGLEYAETVMLNVGLLEGAKRGVVQLLGKYSDKFKDAIYWNKKSSTPHIVQGILTMIVEPIFCFGHYNSRKFPKASFKGNLSNLIEGHNAAKDNSFSDKHSATFPVYLPEHIIKNYTNSTVLDLFMGTGTTMIAAEKCGRISYGMEIDPHYCDIIIQRWQGYTGKTASLNAVM